MEMMTVGGQIVALSAYAMIVEQLATEVGEHPRDVLIKMTKPWASDMGDFFLEDCSRAQMPVPLSSEVDVIAEKLWSRYA